MADLRDLDRQVAESAGDWAWERRIKIMNELHKVPMFFSSSWAATGKLIEHFPKGWSFTLFEYMCTTHCEITYRELCQGGVKLHNIGTGKGDTPQEAICRAYLKAVKA